MVRIRRCCWGWGHHYVPSLRSQHAPPPKTHHCHGRCLLQQQHVLPLLECPGPAHGKHRIQGAWSLHNGCLDLCISQSNLQIFGKITLVPGKYARPRGLRSLPRPTVRQPYHPLRLMRTYLFKLWLAGIHRGIVHELLHDLQRGHGVDSEKGCLESCEARGQLGGDIACVVVCTTKSDKYTVTINVQHYNWRCEPQPHTHLRSPYLTSRRRQARRQAVSKKRDQCVNNELAMTPVAVRGNNMEGDPVTIVQDCPTSLLPSEDHIVYPRSPLRQPKVRHGANRAMS